MTDLLDHDDDDARQQEGEELAELLARRMLDWAGTDCDIEATSRGIDIGFAAAFASTLLHWTTRSLLAEAVGNLINDDDLNLSPVEQVRLHTLVALYFDYPPKQLDDADQP